MGRRRERRGAGCAICRQLGGDVLVANPRPSPATTWPSCPASCRASCSARTARPSATQAVEGGTLIDRRRAAALQRTPSCALRTPAAGRRQRTAIRTDAIACASGERPLRVELNAAGDITRLYDKATARGAAGRRGRQPVPGLRGPADELGRLGHRHLLRRQDVAGRTGLIHRVVEAGPLRRRSRSSAAS